MEAEVISLANTMLVWATGIVAVTAIVIAAATIGITIFFNFKNKANIKKATDKILEQISKDSNIRNKLVEKILSDDIVLKTLVKLPEFKEQLDLSISNHILLIKSYEDNNQNIKNKSLFNNESLDNIEKEILKKIDNIIDKIDKLKG